MGPATNSMRRAILGLLFAVLAPGAAFAQSALTPEQLTLRVERLTELSQRSEAKLGTIQEQLLKLSEDMSKMGRLIDNRAMLEMIQLVDNLSGEISLLNGQIEQQSFDIEGIKKRQRELYLDIDRRLRDLESGASAQAPTGSISLPQVETPLPAVSSSQQTQSDEPALTETMQEETASLSQSPSPTQSEEKAAYQAAFDTLKEGRYKRAKTELKTFIDRYPDSSYAGNAQYWLGEAHYVTRNFDQGIVEFQNVLKRYPTSNKVPDAMLKLGYTYYELKQFEQAKAILADLREKYSQTTAARLATKRLDRIRKEGH
ncbi:MAG: tol-pal system protein YbgF [Gammaproteobacteria bacterium]|nr:tol-pal system protein YbgF [Gammaproteobacteria bacterium]MDH3448730.1 tol-pal system protein YbgF [Gammaproteobacteria bacterium]